MKKTKLTFLFVLCVMIVSAQKTDTIHLKNIDHSSKIVTDRPPQAFYFQLGGSAPFLSVNYDRRFGKKVNGFGFSGGLGFFGVAGASLFSVPVSVNYLIGRSNHFVELAGGTTFLSARVNDFSNNSDNGSGNLFVYHLNLGYRYQPTIGGFFFRGGISPLFASGTFLFTSYYLGFGHNF